MDAETTVSGQSVTEPANAERTVMSVLAWHHGDLASGQPAARLLAGHVSRLALVVGLGLLGAGVATIPLRAETAASATASPARQDVSVPAAAVLVDAQGLTQERRTNQIVDKTREALQRSGASLLFAPTAVQELALREGVILALRKNLDIKRSNLAKSSAERALVEAEALFDPVFVASVNANIIRKYSRHTTVSQYKPGTETVAVGHSDSSGVFTCTAQAAALSVGSGQGKECYVLSLSRPKTYTDVNGQTISDFSTRSAVLAMQYGMERQAGYYQTSVDANPLSSFEPRAQEVYSGTLSLQQLLPWGSSLNLSLSSTRRQTYYPINVYNGMGETYGVYYRPWFTSLVFGASVPLPYTKYFGPTANAEVANQVARHNVDAADVDVRTVINSTLLQVDALYWTLVGQLRQLSIVAEVVAAAEAQKAAINHLYDQQLVTESDRRQAESQVASIQATRQQIFGAYVDTSEQLRRLLDGDKSALYVPVGYQALLDAAPRDISDASLILNNPAYVRQGIAVKIAALVRDQRDAQTRPDLALSGSTQFSQTGSYGFRDLGASVQEVFQPDLFVLSIAALYQRPLGNRAALAALEGAEHSLNQQNLLLRKAELSVRESFDTARASLASAHRQVKLNQNSIKLAEEAYQGSLELQDQGLIPVYESLSRLMTVLNARLGLAQAQIAERLAEAQLLAAVGGLAEQYGERSAQTPEDRLRLARLRESGALKHFGGPL